MKPCFLIFGLVCSTLLCGCNDEKPPKTTPKSDPAPSASGADTPAPGPSTGGKSAENSFPAPADAPFISEELLHVKLKEANPSYNLKGEFQIENNLLRAAILSGTGIQDLSPLRGLPIESLDLQDCPVTDLFHLKGMPLTHLYLDRTKVYDIRPLAGAKLQVLYLDGTGVEDISVLKGMPLTEGNFAGTKVKDIRPLADSPLNILWLSHCPISDISPLKDLPLVSVTLHGTKVTDLRPLSGHTSLQRLHIGETPVTDLTPLAGLKLSRLVFPVKNITKGLDVAKGMFSLQELGTTFENRASPAQFWPGVEAAAAPSAP